MSISICNSSFLWHDSLSCPLEPFFDGLMHNPYLHLRPLQHLHFQQLLLTFLQCFLFFLHFPAKHERPEQQSLFALHVSFAWWHGRGVMLHNPFWHDDVELQHLLVALHEDPSATHRSGIDGDGRGTGGSWHLVIFFVSFLHDRPSQHFVGFFPVAVHVVFSLLHPNNSCWQTFLKQ